jgi:hypothetical protein
MGSKLGYFRGMSQVENKLQGAATITTGAAAAAAATTTIIKQDHRTTLKCIYNY